MIIELLKYTQESDTPVRAFEPFVLLGLLANYNKFEFRNPYRLRLEDFVNEKAIEKIILGFSETCASIRKGYTEVIDDLPVDPSWTLANTLSYIGLGMLAPIKAMNPIAAPEDYKEKFGVLLVTRARQSHLMLTFLRPSSEAAVLLAVYDFTNANKLFNYNLLSTPSESNPAFSTYLSMVSYVLHHAYRTPRSTLYGILCLCTLRIMLEDPALCKQLCDPAKRITVRLCRQRPPLLPPTPSSRPSAAQIMDIATDTINHNLRRRLDLDLYAAAVNLIHRLLICLAQNHIHLPYHWSLLWQSLLSLLRFLQTYASDITAQPADINILITPLLKCLALAIAQGSAFLPDPAAYDDLFYKLVENAPVIEKFKTTFKLSSSIPSATASAAGGQTPASPTLVSSPVDILIATATHFHAILEQEKGKGRLRLTLSAREVNRVIREGYESLEVADVSAMGVEHFEVWREGEERGMVKRAGRLAVEDVRRMVCGWKG